MHRERRRLHDAARTEEAYVGWIQRFMKFTRSDQPGQFGGPEVKEFLSDLVVTGRMAAGTQNQALNALLFFFRKVEVRDLELLDAVRAAPSPRLIDTHVRSKPGLAVRRPANRLSLHASRPRDTLAA